LWFIWSAPEEAPGKSIRVQVQRVNKRVDPHTLPLNSMYYPPHLKMKNQDGQVVLAYWHGNPDSKNPKNYPLNNYIYPLLGLDGETLIAESPHDHIHHRGIFWAWVRNERVGEWHGDWWIPRGITCDPEQLTFADGHVFSRFAAKHTWIYQKSKGGQKDRFMTEYAVCRIFNPDKDTRLVDVDVMLKARGEGVRIGGQTAADKGYSGLTVRFGNAEKVRIETDEQLIEKSSLNQVTAKWIDWTGFFHAPDSKERLPHRSGAAVMVHPSHPDFPPEWITRYYGPINVAWPGLKMQKIPQDKPVILRYRLHVHRGTAKEAGVNQQYQAYAADWKWVQKPLR
jgi:hypothetical protein